MSPFSEPPPPPSTWWRSIPGQLAILAMAVGAIVILLGVSGVIGPRS